MVRPLTRVVVVIPARNEEKRLPSALAAVQRARQSLTAADPGAPKVALWVVADRCTDRTEKIAAGWPDVYATRSNFGNVGAARAAGVSSALGAATDGECAGIWIVCTDADSQVPADWLITQVDHARRGVDLLLGTVRPHPGEMPPSAQALWLARHDLRDGHPHVHGANMGIRANIYRQVGGFAPVPEHEDVVMVQRVRDLGGRIVSTGDSAVLTSARTVGRTPSGMAGYLRQLNRQLPPVAKEPRTADQVSP